MVTIITEQYADMSLYRIEGPQMLERDRERTDGGGGITKECVRSEGRGGVVN